MILQVAMILRKRFTTIVTMISEKEQIAAAFFDKSMNESSKTMYLDEIKITFSNSIVLRNCLYMRKI